MELGSCFTESYVPIRPRGCQPTAGSHARIESEDRSKSSSNVGVKYSHGADYPRNCR